MSERHLGIIHLRWQWLKDLLLLPEGTKILSVEVDNMNEKVLLKVEHPDLPVYREGWTGEISQVNLHHRIKNETFEKKEFESWGW